jgi:hypothetical protein
MKREETILRTWNEIIGLNSKVLNENKFALGHLYDCELVLGLTPLSVIQQVEITKNPITLKKPAFKNLEFSGVQLLRSLNFNEVNSVEVDDWAETLMRYLEINMAILKKKCINTFGSVSIGKEVLLELAAFLLDHYFSTNDLRFLNIVIKLMDRRWLYSYHEKIHLDEDNKKSIYSDLLKVRLWIMREAALKNLAEGTEHA